MTARGPPSSAAFWRRRNFTRQGQASMQLTESTFGHLGFRVDCKLQRANLIHVLERRSDIAVHGSHGSTSSCSRDNVRLTTVAGAGRRYLYSKLIKLVGPFFKLLSVSEGMAGALPLSQDFFRSSVLLAPLPNFSRTCRLVGLCTRVPSKVQAAMQEMSLSKLHLPDVLPSDLWIRVFSFLSFSYKCVAVWLELLCC